MITEKAKRLSNLAQFNSQPLVPVEQVLNDLLKELHINCDPTLEEFISLCGKCYYSPEMFYEANFGSEKVKKLMKRAYPKGTIEIMVEPSEATTFHRGWAGVLEVGREGGVEKVQAVCKFKYRLKSGKTRVVFTYGQ
jgi:hypothetical protein